MPDVEVKKVAILLPNLGGGGAERVALASAKDLAGLGHKVHLVLVEATGELIPLVPEGVRVIDLKAPRIIAALPALAQYLRGERPDTLHAVMWPVTIIGIIAHKLARSAARLVVSDQVALSQQVTGGLQRRLLEWTMRFFYPLADVRITCSATAADDLAKLSGIGRDRIEVIYNPISPPRRIATNARVKALWNGKGPRIITVGSLKEQKNHALLLTALARVKDRSAKLMILGEGPLRGDLDRLAVQLGVGDRVILPGFTVDPWPYLASADLFVLSSDYEGFPLVLAEAMHAGLKVVSTDCVSGPAEMLDGGRYGRLVRCGDADELAAAIDAALMEPADRKKMRDRAIAMAGPAMTSRYSELLTA
jgi:glycosyltransferase involved in cell wall biosynthesis